MSNQIVLKELDESTLANDVVRLLGAENQRLKRELLEAQQRAKDAEKRALEAEARAIVKNEPTETNQHLGAAERVQQLLEEITDLRTQYQNLGSKYDNEKEKRRALKAQVKEYKSQEARGRIEESPELLALREREIQAQAQLVVCNAKVKDLSEQIEQMTNDASDNKRLLSEARDKAKLLACNNPWPYISELFSRYGDFGFTRVNPFRADDERSSTHFKTFYLDTLKPGGLANIPFIYRKRDILWSHSYPGFGVAVSPPHRYTPNRSTPGHHWEHVCIQSIKGPFELLFEFSGFWYYCGTFTTSIIETRNNTNFYNVLRSKFKDQLTRETIREPQLLPPVIGKTIEELYSQGVLHVNCLIFERVGFNEQLYTSLLEFARRRHIPGPVHALELFERGEKRRAEDQTQPAPPKIKKARA